MGDYSQVSAVPGQGFAAAVVQGKPLTSDPGEPAITGLQSAVVAEIALGPGRSGEPRATHRRH